MTSRADSDPWTREPPPEAGGSRPERVKLFPHAGIIHCGWGVLLLLAPEAGLRSCHAPISGSARVVVRLLGLRHLGEGLALITVPHPRTCRWCSAIDAVHACTMLGLAVRKPAYQRAAAVSFTVSGVLAVLEGETGERTMFR